MYCNAAQRLFDKSRPATQLQQFYKVHLQTRLVLRNLQQFRSSSSNSFRPDQTDRQQKWISSSVPTTSKTNLPSGLSVLSLNPRSLFDTKSGSPPSFLDYHSRLQQYRHHGGHSRSISEPKRDLTKQQLEMLEGAEIFEQERVEANQECKRVTTVGVVANVGLAIAKVTAGIVGNSAAMIADAVHSLTDLISDGATYISLRWAERPADDTHPFGYGKYEAAGAIVVASIVTATGCGIGVHAFQLLSEGLMSEDLAPPTVVALGAAVASVGVKEWLYQITIRAGTRYDSKVTTANAWHHRSDALTSIVALVGIGGAMYGFPVLDPIAGILVSGMVVKTGVQIFIESINDLLDRGVVGEDHKSILESVMKTPGVLDAHELRIRRMGPFLSVDVHVQVDPLISVSVAHQTAERVRVMVLATHRKVLEVLVHVDVEEDAASESVRHNLSLMRPENEIERDIKEIISRFPDIIALSHLTCHYLRNTLTAHLDVQMADTLTLADASDIGTDLKSTIEEEIEDVDCCDVHLELDRDHCQECTIHHHIIEKYNK